MCSERGALTFWSKLFAASVIMRDLPAILPRTLKAFSFYLCLLRYTDYHTNLLGLIWRKKFPLYSCLVTASTRMWDACDDGLFWTVLCENEVCISPSSPFKISQKIVFRKHSLINMLCISNDRSCCYCINQTEFFVPLKWQCSFLLNRRHVSTIRQDYFWKLFIVINWVTTQPIFEKLEVWVLHWLG